MKTEENTRIAAKELLNINNQIGFST